MAEHVPTPWELDPSDELSIVASDGTHITMVTGLPGFPCVDPEEWDEDQVEAECQANAAFIVRACNAHDELVAALIAARDALRSYQYGNSATDLAKEIADHATAVIVRAEAR